jgi:5-methylthioadenosine/S-adenosylhomocysteine deaminase
MTQRKTYDLLIRDTTVLEPSGASFTFVAGRDVAIAGSRITAIEPTGNIPVDTASKVVDGRNQVTLPGLINAHAHSAMVLLRGVAEDVTVESWFNDHIWRLETNLMPEDAYWGMKLAAAEMIRGGVTGVADHYFFMDDIAQACREVGLRAHLAPTMFGQNPDEELAQARTFVERWHGAGDGLIQAWLGPHSPYLCSGAFLRDVLTEAKATGVGVHLHVSETAQQVQASLETHDLTPPQYLDSLGLFEVPVLVAHAAHATSEDITLLSRAGAGVAHCPKTFLKLASGIVNVTEMLEQGVHVGLGTDGAASNNTLDVLEQMRLMALLQKHERHDATVLTRFEALRVATQGGAAVVRQADRLGRIAVGYLADLITVRLGGLHLQPLHDLAAALVYSAYAADVDTVIVNGRVLMEGRRLLTIDEAEVLEQVTRRAARIRDQVPQGQLQIFPS